MARERRTTAVLASSPAAAAWCGGCSARAWWRSSSCSGGWRRAALAEDAADLAGDPAQPRRGGRAASRALLNERALLASIAATLQRVLDRLRARDPRRRAARHPRRIVARGRGVGRAARALRPQHPGRRADPADDPVVRDRRDAEDDVHLHRLRAVRVLRRRPGDHGRPRSLRRDGADARRVAASDRHEGAGRRWRCPTSTAACGTCSGWRSATSCWRN